MADHFPDTYFPPSYFAGSYFEGGEQNPGAMSASLSGSAAVSAVIGIAALSDRGGDGLSRKARRAKSRASIKNYLDSVEANKEQTPAPVIVEVGPRPKVANPVKARPAEPVVLVAAIDTEALARAAAQRQDEEDIELLLLAA